MEWILALLKPLARLAEKLLPFWFGNKAGKEKQRRKHAEAELDAIEHRNKQDAKIKSKKRKSVIGRIMRK